MTRFFLVRHGETEWNKKRIIQGVSDIPLNDTGRAQAASVGAILARHSFDLIVSSPLSRALETATIIARRLGMPAPVVIEDLKERNYGEAEGSSGADLDQRYPPGVEVPGREPREAVIHTQTFLPCPTAGPFAVSLNLQLPDCTGSRSPTALCTALVWLPVHLSWWRLMTRWKSKLRCSRMPNLKSKTRWRRGR